MIERIVNIVNSIVWSPALVILLICAGVYLTIRLRFVQIRHLDLMCRYLKEGRYTLMDSGEGKKGKHVSSFEAFCISLSGRIGSGNIVGVAMAIALGGPGAVFWMWVIAFFGAGTAFVESTLSQIYRTSHNGVWTGGPFAYIDKGLKQRWLGVVFAIFTIVSYGFLLVCVQTNCIATAFANAFSVPPVLSGVVTMVLLFAVIVGGSKRIAKVSSAVAPIMSILYIVMAVIIIGMHWQNIPAVFASIFKGAFGLEATLGGILGSTISMGVKRGLFSNEAGQGGGAIVSASADVDHPAKQGLVQASSVYIDTLLICTATALMILCTGMYNVYDAASGEALVMNAPELGNNYVAFSQAAIDSIFPGLGSSFIAVALYFFVFTSLMAYYFYTSSSLMYLSRSLNITDPKKIKAGRAVCQAAMLAMVVLGCCTSSATAWTIGDIGVGLTTWINVIALLLLSPRAISALRELEAGLKNRKKNG